MRETPLCGGGAWGLLWEPSFETLASRVLVPQSLPNASPTGFSLLNSIKVFLIVLSKRAGFLQAGTQAMRFLSHWK